MRRLRRSAHAFSLRRPAGAAHEIHTPNGIRKGWNPLSGVQSHLVLHRMKGGRIYASMHKNARKGLTSRTECDMMKRGEIYWADLNPVVGSEQGGIRPVIIVQNDIGNRHSTTVIVAAITSSGKKAYLPVHVPITAEESGLARDSVVLLEQLRTLEKSRLMGFLGRLKAEAMARIDRALALSLGTG